MRITLEPQELEQILRDYMAATEGIYVQFPKGYEFIGNVYLEEVPGTERFLKHVPDEEPEENEAGDWLDHSVAVV